MEKTKRGRGRPKFDAAERRSVRLELALTPGEMVELMRAAEASGEGRVAVYVRERALASARRQR